MKKARTTYAHAGVCFPDVHLARVAVLLSDLEVKWRFTPDSQLVHFELREKGFGIRLAKNGDPMPTPAEVASYGEPIALMPRVDKASNRLQAVGASGRRDVYLIGGAAWTPEFAAAFHTANAAFPKPDPLPAWLTEAAKEFC